MEDVLPIELVIGFKNIKMLENPTFFQKVISWWTKSDYVHVELAICDKWICADEEKGVFIKDYDPNRQVEGWEYIKLKNVNLTSTQVDDIMGWVSNINGSKYDWISILLCHSIPLGIDHRSKFTCSELAAKLLQALHYPGAIFLRPERMNPKDVYNFVKK